MIQNFETLKKQVRALPVRTIVVAMAEDTGVLTAVKQALMLKMASSIEITINPTTAPMTTMISGSNRETNRFTVFRTFSS